MNTVYLALGANICGPWGLPHEALLRARRELELAGLQVVRASATYTTAPLGPGRQSPYVNAVLVIHSRMAPSAVLRLVKRIERQAGRRSGRRWGPRPLDIDILDLGGRRLGWPPGRRVRGGMVLPHPEMHRRAFVLVPLLEVAPHWRHPALGVGARALLGRIGPLHRAGVRRKP